MPASYVGALVRLGAVVFVLAALGCGMLTDSDRIRIAKIDDREITRGDLNEVIRNMSPEERPVIRTKYDLLRTLETYVDNELKAGLAKQMEAEGKLKIPRELAEQQYRALHPDEPVVDLKNPEQVGLSKAEADFLKDERETAVDKLYEKLKGEAAVSLRVQQAIKDGMRPTEEEYEREYKFRKDTLKNFEQIVFRGLYFPADKPDGGEMAAQVRQRLESGAKLDDLVTEYATAHGGKLFESGIENNPAVTKFMSFWQQASGANVGDVIGPIYISGWDALRQDEKGQSFAGRLPDAYLTCVVIDHKPETPKTLDEAKGDLAPTILYSKVIEQMRTEHGVEIYEDKLPDPSIYDPNRANSIFDAKGK